MKALYQNDKFVRFERASKEVEKIASSEWIEVIEDDEPTPTVNP